MSEAKKLIPVRSDIIDALIYLLDMGYPPERIAGELNEIKPTQKEIKDLLSAKKVSNDFLSIFDNYLKSNEGDLIIQSNSDKKVKCTECNNGFPLHDILEIRFIEANNSDLPHQVYQGNNVVFFRICKACHTQMTTNLPYCNTHNALVTDGLPKCGLFEKCHPNNCCNNPVCLENHYAKSHSKYQERHWRPTKKFLGGVGGKIITSPIPVGVEFEVVAKDLLRAKLNIYKLDRNLGITSDEAMREYHNPTEIITPPSNLRKLENLVENVCMALREDGFLPNLRCGLHIHLGVEKIYGKINQNPMFYKSLLLAYSMLEPIFQELLPQTRIGNRYCLSIPWPSSNFLSLDSPKKWESMKLSEIWYASSDKKDIKRRINGKRDRTKYTSFSFHSLFRKMGVEIRTLEGTLNPKLILNWINLHQKFIEGVAGLPYYFHMHPSISKVYPSQDIHLNAMRETFEAIVFGACQSVKEKEILENFLKERREIHKKSIFRNIDDYPRQPKKITWITKNEDKKSKKEAFPTPPSREEMLEMLRDFTMPRLNPTNFSSAWPVTMSNDASWNIIEDENQTSSNG